MNNEALAKLSEVRAPIRTRTASDSVLIPGKRGFARGSNFFGTYIKILFEIQQCEKILFYSFVGSFVVGVYFV
jgi:hypothetical protein